MQPSCTVFHSARSRKHGRRHVKPTHIPWSGRLHFARCFLVSMIDRRPDPRRIQQLHVDGMAPDIRARKDHARATSRRVCTPSSVGRKIATPWRAARARKAAKRLCKKIELRPLPAATTVVPVLSRGCPSSRQKHRGEDTHGKHGAHGHGSQLGGTVSNNPASTVLQVFSLSRFTVNKKDQSELVGSAPGRSTGCRVCRVTVHSQWFNSAPKTPDRRTYRCG